MAVHPPWGGELCKVSEQLYQSILLQTAQSDHSAPSQNCGSHRRDIEESAVSQGGSGSGTKRRQEARNSPRSKPRSSWGGSPASAMDPGVPRDPPLSLEWILPCTPLLGCGEPKGLSPVMPQVVQEPSWWDPLGGSSWPEICGPVFR